MTPTHVLMTGPEGTLIRLRIDDAAWYLMGLMVDPEEEGAVQLAADIELHLLYGMTVAYGGWTADPR